VGFDDGADQLKAASVTVVIPTYNRGPALRTTVESLLRNDPQGLSEVGIIVVDDGSSPPIGDLGVRTPVPFGITVLRQENRGPASARNRGFRAAKGQTVIFMDDDVVAPPDLISAHVAAHRRFPNSVIFGRCRRKPPEREDAVFRTMVALDRSDTTTANGFQQADRVSSGQLSVERGQFEAEGGVYCDELSTPAAEEFELSLRLKQRGIPALLAASIVAVHDSPLSIEALCRQQYKHGLGYAEAALRRPDTRRLPELAAVIQKAQALGLVAWDRPRAGLRALASGSLGRATLLKFAKLAERWAPQSDALRPLYVATIAAHFAGGVRDGLRKSWRSPPDRHPRVGCPRRNEES